MQKLAALLLVTFLTGCVFPGVYKINVQQGNIVTEEDLVQLEKGMTREQVRSVLGTPLVLNPIDLSREYYVYTFQEAGGEIRQQRVIVYYDASQFDYYEAELLDNLPAY